MHYEAGFLFYALALLAMAVFALGMYAAWRLWTLGKHPGEKQSVLSGNWLKSFGKAVFVQSQIREYGTFPWVTHLMIFYGFMALFILTTLEFILKWFMPAHFIHTPAIIAYFEEGPGIILLALWGDFWGLVLLGGIGAALYRRYIIKPEKFDTISEDSIAIWLLFVITITGFLCEAVRLAVRPDAADFYASFAVFWMAPIIKLFGPTESTLTTMFYFHGIISLFFIGYIPFSKFRHIIAAPVVYAFTFSNTKRYIKERPLPREQQTEQQAA